MKANELRLGMKVCDKHTKYPMVVVGLYTSLQNINNGKDDCDVYLDFKGNKGNIFVYKASELEGVEQ